MKKQLSLVLFLVLLLTGLTVLPAAAQDTCVTDTGYATYLDNQFGIALAGEVSQDDFASAASSIVGEVELPAAVDLDGFTNLEAVLNSLYYVNLDELALTYTPEKIETAVADLVGSADLSDTQQAELAAALDSGLLAEGCTSVDWSAPLDAAFANELLGNVLVFTGQYQHEIGLVSDADIYNELLYAYNSFDQVLLPEVQENANQLIRDGIITGYNLKRSALNANFDPQRTIIYGHANIDHAVQLIALLRSEGVDARVQLEPKTSAFLYLAEWGEPSVAPEFQVEALDDGNYIAYAKEYDLAFEFATVEDRDRFDPIILAYAKRDAEDETGLIVGSWWQPLYSSRVPIDGYVQVVNNVVHLGSVYLQTFSLVDSSEAILENFETAYPDNEVEVYDLWVNVAFHNYLNGEPL